MYVLYYAVSITLQRRPSRRTPIAATCPMFRKGDAVRALRAITVARDGRSAISAERRRSFGHDNPPNPSGGDLYVPNRGFGYPTAAPF